MKAILLPRYGGPEQFGLEDVPDPVPQPGEVLVRVAATSINPFDLKIRSGSLQEVMPLKLPVILGLDLAGVVENVGQEVSQFSSGDVVFAHANQCYAELCIVKATDLAKLPSGMDVVSSAALPTVLTTGAQLANLALGNSPARTVLVAGAAGNVGRSAVFEAKRRGATVIAGVLQRQASEAGTIGADRVVFLDEDQDHELESVDAVADTVGGQTAQTLIGRVREGGMFASVVGEPANAKDYPAVAVKTMQVTADPQILTLLAEAVQSGKLRIPLGPRFTLAEMSKAHLAAESGAPGKILVTV